MSAEFDSLLIPANSQVEDLVRASVLTGIPQALAATGSIQSDAALVVYTSSLVSAADGTKGVRLPADAAGRSRWIHNAGSGTLKVYPPTGGNIDGGTTNAAVTLAAGLGMLFVFASATAIKSFGAGSTTGAPASPLNSAEVTFTETAGAGVWTGSVTVPAGATVVDVIVNGVALWDSETSATLIVGDVANDDGYFTAVDLKATDLLAGESLSFALAGGKAGAYIANSQVSPRYAATERTVSGIITKVGDTGTAGRTRLTVVWSLNTATAATKV